MDQKYNTSFIPKKFLAEDVQGGSASKYVKQRTLIGPGYFIAMAIFVLALGASVALFLYTRVVMNSIEENMTILQAQIDEVRSEDISEFLELEKQMNIASTLLENHIAVSELLHKLEQTTLANVWYAAMNFTGGISAPAVVIGGSTRALTNVALQMREFEADRHFVTPSLSRLEREAETGLISFDVRSDILKDLLLYEVAVHDGRHGKSQITQPARTSTPVETTSTQ